MTKNQTLIDYVNWRGDLSFEQSEFNLLDALVLCHLSYVDFKPSGLVDGDAMTLHTAGNRILEQNAYELRNLSGGHQDFFETIISTKRYGSLQIHSYVDMFDPKSKVQFCAVTFNLNDTDRYIAFRGTDDSLTGWKEDFMLSFTKIQSQSFAEEYLNMHVQEGYHYRIGGHSKGGNLALFAFLQLDKKKKQRIDHIDNFDGPGLNEELVDIHTLDPYLSMITKVTPSFSIIGRIYDLVIPDTIIIQSDGFGISQHDLINWNIEYLSFKTTDKYDPTSTWLIESINTWAKSTPIKHREEFINEVFDMLYASGVEHIQDISIKGLQRILDAMGNSDDNIKKITSNLIRISLGLKPTELLDGTEKR